MPARGRVFRDFQLTALGDEELLADQVVAGGFLGDRVLDLEAGVDLQEGDQAVGGDEVLDGAGAVVARLAADVLGGGVDALALGVGEERRGGLLHELLEAALQRAVAGAHDDDVAVLVGQHLRLDVAGLVQVALDEALAAAEGGQRLTGGGLVELRDLFLGVGDLHAAAAAAVGGLDGDGQAVLLGEGDDLVRVRDGVLGARGHRGVGPLGDVSGGDLVAQVADGLRGRADPDQAGVDDGAGEVGVFGEEAVAGVDRVGAGLGGGVDDLVDRQVRLRRGLPAEGERLVGHADERGVRVGLCVHGHGRDARVFGRAENANRDFAAVRHQDLGDLLGLNCHLGTPPGIVFQSKLFLHTKT